MRKYIEIFINNIKFCANGTEFSAVMNKLVKWKLQEIQKMAVIFNEFTLSNKKAKWSDIQPAISKCTGLAGGNLFCNFY